MRCKRIRVLLTGPWNANLANLLKRGCRPFSLCHANFFWHGSPNLRPGWNLGWNRSRLAPDSFLEKENWTLLQMFLADWAVLVLFSCVWAVFCLSFDGAPWEPFNGSELVIILLLARCQAQSRHPRPHMPPMYFGRSSAHVAPGCPGMLAAWHTLFWLAEKRHLVQGGTCGPADDLWADESDDIVTWAFLS